jgi:hypothetical protein
MSVLLQCPFCPAQIKVSDSAALTTCPKCFRTFDVNARGKSTSSRAAKRDSNDAEEEDSAPSNINPLGAVGLILATFGLLSATLLGNRGLTYTMLGLGITAVILGFALAAVFRKTGNLGWLVIGGMVNAAVLSVVLFAPGLLNRYWAMDAAPPQPDLHQMTAFSGEPDDIGRVLAPADVVDATNSIAQDGVSLRIVAAATGEVAGKGTKRFLLVWIRVSCIGYQRPITFEGFGSDKHRPTLKGAAGESYAFVEQRARKLPAGGVVFLTAAPHPVDIQPTRCLDFQLVFEAPPADFSPLTLQLPASAWGRNGVCKYRIDRLFAPKN